MRALLLVACVWGWAATALAGPTLDAVKARGHLVCGVNHGLAGFSIRDAKGLWKGFDADFCHAVAAAVLGDRTKVTFRPLTAAERFDRLKRGEVDLLARNTTWTQSRDTEVGIDFASILLYDAQAFMSAARFGLQSALELENAAICVQSGTTTAQNLADYSDARRLRATIMPFVDPAAAARALVANQCVALTADLTALAGIRATLPGGAAAWTILPQRISKEPLAAAVRQGDSQWLDIVRWTGQALLAAEEFGITARTVEQSRTSSETEVRRLLGVTPGTGKGLGLDDRWAARAIAAVGNYGEMFERNLGVNSELELERGPNALWTKGGLMYALPFR